jgi:hypothetical protein
VQSEHTHFSELTQAPRALLLVPPPPRCAHPAALSLPSGPRLHSRPRLSDSAHLLHTLRALHAPPRRPHPSLSDASPPRRAGSRNGAAR